MTTYISSILQDKYIQLLVLLIATATIVILLNKYNLIENLDEVAATTTTTATSTNQATPTWDASDMKTLTPDGTYVPPTDDDIDKLENMLEYEQELDKQHEHVGELAPTDLLPPVDKDVELYNEYAPDVKFSQPFLNNAFSAGIVVSTPQKGYVNDLRGGISVPFAADGDFNVPTQWPDLYRKDVFGASTST